MLNQFCKIVVLAILLALIGILRGQSQEPSPGGLKSGSPQQTAPQGSKQQSTPDQRGTYNVPLIVKVLPTPKTDEEAAQDRKDRDAKATDDREIIRYSRDLDILTAILIVVGILQLFVFGYQAIKLRQTVRTMELTERPHMLISDIKIRGIKNKPDETGAVKIVYEYKASNYGKSPAFLKKTYVNIAIAANLSDPPPRIEPKAIRFIVAVDGWYGTFEPNEVLLDGTAVRDVFAGQRELFVWGLLEYSGTFPLTHKTRFAFRMIFDDDGNSKQFYPDGPDSYWENT